MNKDKERNTWKVISGILLVLFILGGYYFISNPLEVEVEEEPNALIYTDFTSWAPELGNNNNKIFNYFVYNFGDVEAKDVIVQCVVLDDNDNVVRRVTKDLGNLASGSYEAGEMYEYISEDASGYFGYCLTKSCSNNCEILDHKIQDIAKYM